MIMTCKVDRALSSAEIIAVFLGRRSPTGLDGNATSPSSADWIPPAVVGMG
jgi:hypothetical protein